MVQRYSDFTRRRALKVLSAEDADPGTVTINAISFYTLSNNALTVLGCFPRNFSNVDAVSVSLGGIFFSLEGLTAYVIRLRGTLH